MLINYFKQALRGFRKNKVFTFINVSGLTLGISAALVIYFIVQYDFGFDKFHKDRQRIYRIVTDFKFSGQEYFNSGVPTGMGTAVKNEVSGLESSALFFQYNWDVKVSVPSANPEKPVVYKKVNDIVFADEHYFRIFSYQWLAGSPQQALREPYKLVLTETKAKKYFPSASLQDIIGQTVYYNDTVKTTVAGIVKDISQSTDLTFTEFISLATIPGSNLKNNFTWNDWQSTNGSTQLFIKLAPGTAAEKIRAQLTAIQKKYKKDAPNGTVSFNLQQLGDIHFTSNYGTNFAAHTANKKVLYGLMAVAAFILLLGCINFINLTTAQAAQRAKEIGVRKTMGSSVKQLMLQFLSETFLVTLLAAVLSLLLSPVLLKLFGAFTPPGLPSSVFTQPHIFIFIIILILVVTFFSGFYPAVILAKFKPVQVLKNQVAANSAATRKAWLRKTLTVSQFVIAQFFIMATLVVSKQIHYLLSKDMGFAKEAIINMDAPFFDADSDRRFVFLNKLKAIPEIKTAAIGGNPPASGNTWSGEIKYADGKKEVSTDVQFKMGDSLYTKIYQLKLVAGNYLAYSDTPRAFLINETYARVLGFSKPGDAVGKYLNWSNKQLPVEGVLADFNQGSLHDNIKPLVFTGMKGNFYTYHLALHPYGTTGNNWKNALAKIEAEWKTVFPEEDFSYRFYDKDIEDFYKAEKDMSGLLRWATGICIFISCLGLLGLVIYTTNLRTKEIGVRKVLGASVSQIISLLTKDFLSLILVAFLIAAPLAWWAMNYWLHSFAYRTGITWWLFLLCGASMVLVALLVLSVRLVKTAVANPVKSLRTE